MSNLHPARALSVDALRGLTVAMMLIVNNPGDLSHIYAPLPHTQWDGCSLADMVFPFFLFIVGVSVTLGTAAAERKGLPSGAMHRRMLIRSAKLILAGLLINVAMTWTFHLPHFFVMGELQRIGICYLVAAWIALHLHSSAQWALVVALLLGYALLLQLGGSYAPFENIADRIDNAILGTHAIISDPLGDAHRDPNGLLSTLGALTTTLLGVRAGDWLQGNKTRHLLVAGSLLLIAGLAWSHAIPINKKMWTGSFVFWTGGWAMLGLGICHELIDRRHWPALGRTLGVNAITAFVGSLLMFFALYRLGWWQPIYQHAFASWLTPMYGPYFPSLCYAVAFTGMAWLVLKYLDRRGWYLTF